MKAYRSAGLWLLALFLLLALAAGCSRAKSDAQLATEVQNKINSDFAITTKQIGIQVNNGVVTLSGQVSNEMERAAAANDAAQVEGVRTVVNNLTVAEQAAAFSEPEAQPAAPAASAARPSPSRRTATRQPARTYSDAPARTSAPSGTTTAAAPAPKPIPPVEVAEGTTLTVRMLDGIDTEKNQAGDRFRATLDEPVVIDGQVVIPANADVEGRVVDLASAGRFKGRSELGLQLTRISFSGKSYQIQTNEWSKAGGSRGKRTAATIGGGAALGAIIGGIAGGGKGAAIGAAVGAGAGTGVQAATKGEQVRIAPETVLNFRLEQPVTVTPSTRNRTPARVYEETSEEETDTEDPGRPTLKRR